MLPPSETKVSGGGAVFQQSALAFPELAEVRDSVMTALVELSRDRVAAAKALKLGPRAAADLDANEQLPAAPAMPSIERYTGVVFDAIDVSSLPATARDRANEILVIGSALFGMTAAHDRIPHYRLSANSKLPGIPLGKVWADSMAAAFRAAGRFVIDARSTAYRGLAPVPADVPHITLDLMADSSDGRRALGHFGKHAKGALVRALIESEADLDETNVIDWFEAAPGVSAVHARGEQSLEVVMAQLAR